MIKFIQEIKEKQRECVLFIGTQFSNLYTAMDTPARGRVVCNKCVAKMTGVPMCCNVLLTCCQCVANEVQRGWTTGLPLSPQPFSI